MIEDEDFAAFEAQIQSFVQLSSNQKAFLTQDTQTRNLGSMSRNNSLIIDQKENLVDLFMTMRNPEGQNLLEQCCFTLFERKDERFLFCVLRKVPNIASYLHIKNEEGSLPLFRIIHLF